MVKYRGGAWLTHSRDTAHNPSRFRVDKQSHLGGVDGTRPIYYVRAPPGATLVFGADCEVNVLTDVARIEAVQSALHVGGSVNAVAMRGGDIAVAGVVTTVVAHPGATANVTAEHLMTHRGRVTVTTKPPPAAVPPPAKT